MVNILIGTACPLIVLVVNDCFKTKQQRDIAEIVAIVCMICAVVLSIMGD